MVPSARLARGFYYRIKTVVILRQFFFLFTGGLPGTIKNGAIPLVDKDTSDNLGG